MFSEVKGFVYCVNLLSPDELSENIVTIEDSDHWFWDNRLHKFIDDEIFINAKDTFVLLDGHIDNRKELIAQCAEKDWEKVAIELIKDSIEVLRGGFCGIIKDCELTRLFVDQVGNKAIYYYVDGNKQIVSNNFFFITAVFKKNKIAIKVDEQAVKYMLTLGYMADNTTFCKDIKRVCPGEYVDIDKNGTVFLRKYYRLDNTQIRESISEKKAVEELDYYFRQAVKREFDKDVEYGYRHLVDLSGGLDSRMVSWVAHDMGYIDQINIDFCRKGSLDFIIAQDIACDLKHKFIYSPLDDFKWYEDIEYNTLLLNAASPYSHSTGTRHLMEIIKGCECGIEHTGMNGDVILGTYFSDKEYNNAKANGLEKACSHFLNYPIPQDILKTYDNRELYVLNTRGLLGVESSYMLRQNYFETSSPFLDVDFLNFILSIPFSYRARHYLYFLWIKEFYPKASEYGWEKWGGFKPQGNKFRIRKKVNQSLFVAKKSLYKVIGKNYIYGMNPIEYWVSKMPEKKEYLNAFYHESRDLLNSMISSRELINDIEKMYNNGVMEDKEQIVTLCAAIRFMFN